MRFADLDPGREFRLGPTTLGEADILAFARDYDPQWFHTDPARASASVWRGLIASGWQTCGLAMRLVCDGILAGSESYGSPGLAYLKWDNPVRPGDLLSLKVTVLDRRVARSKPTLGILRWRWQLANQHGASVLDLEATSLFDLAQGQVEGFSASARA
jgi:acyl dehydratase